MKRFMVLGFILAVTLPALAVEGDGVKYLGGTVPGVKTGVVGRFATASESALIFEHSGGKLAIPYDAIASYQYSQEVARHLGVLPMIAAGLFRVRQRRHFVRISYRDANHNSSQGSNRDSSRDSNGGASGVLQVAVFEVPKGMPRTLRPVLEARAPGTDRSCLPCAGRN